MYKTLKDTKKATSARGHLNFDAHSEKRGSKHNFKLKKHHKLSVHRIFPEIYKVRKLLLHVHKVANMDPVA